MGEMMHAEYANSVRRAQKALQPWLCATIRLPENIDRFKARSPGERQKFYEF